MSTVVNQRKVINLRMKKLDNVSIPITLNAGSTVEDLFKAVNEQAGYTQDQIQIVHAGKVIPADTKGLKRPIAELNIVDRSTIFIVGRLLGGWSGIFI